MSFIGPSQFQFFYRCGACRSYTTGDLFTRGLMRGNDWVWLCAYCWIEHWE